MDAKKLLIEDVACELMERLTLLADFWDIGATKLNPVLLEVLQNPNSPSYIKSGASKLLCTFAKAKIKSFHEFSINDQIENLLLGPLFAQPVSKQNNHATKEEDATEVFLLDLARSPAQPVHQSAAQALHAIISARPKLRFSTMQAKGKSPVLEDVVRIACAAYLKHTCVAPIAYRLAHLINHDDKKQQFGSANEIKILEMIWKAGWNTALNIINVYKKSQRIVCGRLPDCNKPAVEDDGKWRCEDGHVEDDYELEEVKTYQEICAQVAARARVLLNLACSNATANVDEDSENIIDKIHPMLQHAKRFVGSSSTDKIEHVELELYLKLKARYASLRLEGLIMLHDIINGLTKLRSSNLSFGSKENQTLTRLAAIQAAATRGAAYQVRRQLSNSSFDDDDIDTDNVPVMSVSFSEPGMFSILEAIREAFCDMLTYNDKPGHHPLDFQMPSNSAYKIQTTTYSILDLLFRTVEEKGINSEEGFLAIRVFEIISIKASDHSNILKLRLVQRLLNLVTWSLKANNEYLSNLTWSLFSRFAIQIMACDLFEAETLNGDLSGFDDAYKETDLKFREGFTQLQKILATSLYNFLFSHLKGLEDPSLAGYEVSEAQCYQSLSLIGALCFRQRTTHNFSTLLVSEDISKKNSTSDHKKFKNDMLALIKCSSPRIQQLAIRLSRRIFVYVDAFGVAPELFHVCGKWSLATKGFTSAGGLDSLAREGAELLRYLACKNPDNWGKAIIVQAEISATKFLSIYKNYPTSLINDENHSKKSNQDILYKFWTTLMILNVSAPATLRMGCRVKIVPGGNGFLGWNESRTNQEYGIVIRMPKRIVKTNLRKGGLFGSGRSNSNNSENMLRQDSYIDSEYGSQMQSYSSATSFIDETYSGYMVILDSNSYLIPTKCDVDKVLPVTMMREEHKDFFPFMRRVCKKDVDWMLDIFEFFTNRFRYPKLSKNLAWSELKALSISVLHSWLLNDPSYAIQQIAIVRPTIWRDILSISACPAPISSLENVDDLSTTCQALADIKVALCEFGTAPEDFMFQNELNKYNAKEGINTIIEEKNVSNSIKNGNEPKNTNNINKSKSNDTMINVDEALNLEEQKSLLSAPMLQPGRRAALARQASTQMFPQKQHILVTEKNDTGSSVIHSENNNLTDINDKEGEDNNMADDDDDDAISKNISKDSEQVMLPVRRHSNCSIPPSRLSRRSSGSIANIPIGRIEERPSNTIRQLHRRSTSTNRRNLNVQFETSTKNNIILETPFREIDRNDHSSYTVELQIERNRRRARLERKRRDKRRLRTLSSSAHIDNRLDVGLSNGEHIQQYLCQPDTPRGRDAATLTLPVALPTVDTMLPVPISTGTPNNRSPGGGSFGLIEDNDAKQISSQKHQSNKSTMKWNISRRAVVKKDTILRISHDEIGVVKQVKQALIGNEMALVHVYNTKTGFQSTCWRDIANLELSADAIVDRYRLIMNKRQIKRQSFSQQTMNEDIENKASDENLLQQKLSDKVIQLCSRSAILHARLAAVAAISGSVCNDEEKRQKLHPLVGEAGGVSEILGMLKLCESSCTNSLSKLNSNNFESSTSGLWRAVAALFASNTDFADMLLDEAVLYLSMRAKETLLFETPHPLCPLEDLASQEFDGDDISNENDSPDDARNELPPPPNAPSSNNNQNFQNRMNSRTSMEDTSFSISASENEGNQESSNNINFLQREDSYRSNSPSLSELTVNTNSSDNSRLQHQQHNNPPSPTSIKSTRSNSSHMQFTSRKLSGSHRFCIKEANGLLVEFDRRSSVISAATQVTLSYDPQDREVIKVLGEGGADAWQPVVVSGDTCYMHWSVNQSDIINAMERMEDLHVDLEEVAWGVAVRVQSLEENSNADEIKILEKPFGWRLMQVLADNPDQILARKEAGIRFFETAISFLRTSNLALKPDVCEIVTLLAKAVVSKTKSMEFDWYTYEEKLVFKSWANVIKQGLYKLHHDLLLLFDNIAEAGFTSVSPYFVCLLELLVLCRGLWALQGNTLDAEKTHMLKLEECDYSSKSYNLKPPLCSLVVFGQREHNKLVVDCETCELTGNLAVCVACASKCHIGHKLVNERTSSLPCGCSLRGPEACKALRPYADVWRIGISDRTWFDVVCQTADVIDCINGGQRPIPASFVKESYRTCEDGKLLRLCLRSLEECLRSEVQEAWWDREARHMWANMIDQGLDSTVEVAFALKVLVSSLRPSAFANWWKSKKELRHDWFSRVHTNQAWALAQAMLQLSCALSPSACYSEWDARLKGWTDAVTSIADMGQLRGDSSCCTYIITGEFPRPQIYVKCLDCKGKNGQHMEICECCAEQHAAKGHHLSEEVYAVGFCDERNQLPKEKCKPRFEKFSAISKFNFENLHDLYWTSNDEDDTGIDDQVPAEPRTLSALLNVPQNAFFPLHNKSSKVNGHHENFFKKSSTRLIECVPSELSSEFSNCFRGILIEILGIKEDSSFLCVSCDADHGSMLATGSILANDCKKYGKAIVHGIASSPESAQCVKHNIHALREEMGVPLAPIEVFSGNLIDHAKAANQHRRKSKKLGDEDFINTEALIPGMLKRYDRIFVNGICTLEELDALSMLLPLDGSMLCPMVDSLGYGIFVLRNQFNGEFENRTLAPLYEDSEDFLRCIGRLRPILSFDPPLEKRKLLHSNESDANKMKDADYYSNAEIDYGFSLIKEENIKWEERFDNIGKAWDLNSWISLSNFVGKQIVRDTQTLGFRDINSNSLEAYPLLQQVDIDVIQGRFSILKRINDSLSEVIPLINLTPQYSTGGIGKLLSKSDTKKLIFLSTKLEAWNKVISPTWSEAPSQSMPSITVSRNLADLGQIEDSLFMQTYNQIQNFPLQTLRRRDQSFKVRFAGEGGHDVGGLYRDLFSEMCIEIREGKPPLFFNPPNASKGSGEPLLPRPSVVSSVDQRLFEFVGILIAIACMRHGITLSVDLSPLLWKMIVRDELETQDLMYIDEVSLQAVSFIRRSTKEELGDVFSDSVFSLEPIDSNYQESCNNSKNPTSSTPKSTKQEYKVGSNNRNNDSMLVNKKVVELCPLGKERKVTQNNALEYSNLVEDYRLNECKSQINAIKRGLIPLIPTRLLPMFTWQELANLVCGVADVDVELLHSRTKYVGGVLLTDQHIKFFWDVLANDFTPEDRTQFLRFVWGRERMSTAEENSTFTIGPHLKAKESGNPDQYLPCSHTCFFSLDLPAYSSREIMKSKLNLAIKCISIDADMTAEGQSNMNMNIN